MSTAFYPQGMRPGNGSALPQGGYKTWKGSGALGNPVGVGAKHIRPLTNLDPGNVFPGPFGRPRPIKHYRKGTLVAPYLPPPDPETTTPAQQAELAAIAFNCRRAVRSSVVDDGIRRTMDTAGDVPIRTRANGNAGEDCLLCDGVKFVSSQFPIVSLTETPEPFTAGREHCCNAAYNARRRVLPPSTVLKKNYFQTTQAYLRQRCQLFAQREFNFAEGPATDVLLRRQKPGDAVLLAANPLYVAQCNPTGALEMQPLDLLRICVDQGWVAAQSPAAELLRAAPDLAAALAQLRAAPGGTALIAAIAESSGVQNILSTANGRKCTRVYYKPNNPQFAQQGGVSSSTRTFKRGVDDIARAVARALPQRLKNKAPEPHRLCGQQAGPGAPFFVRGRPPAKRMCLGGAGAPP
jgi:hypothetical protein